MKSGTDQFSAGTDFFPRNQFLDTREEPKNSKLARAEIDSVSDASEFTAKTGISSYQTKFQARKFDNSAFQPPISAVAGQGQGEFSVGSTAPPFVGGGTRAVPPPFAQRALGSERYQFQQQTQLAPLQGAVGGGPAAPGGSMFGGNFLPTHKPSASGQFTAAPAPLTLSPPRSGGAANAAFLMRDAGNMYAPTSNLVFAPQGAQPSNTPYAFAQGYNRANSAAGNLPPMTGGVLLGPQPPSQQQQLSDPLGARYAQNMSAERKRNVSPSPMKGPPAAMRLGDSANAKTLNHAMQPLVSALKKSNLPIPQDLLNFDQDYFPQYTMFLLSEEDQNIANFRERVEREKKRIESDFDSSKQEYLNLLEDLKIQLNQQVDEHFKLFIERYKKFKNEVVEFKNIKLDLPMSQIQPPGKYDGAQNSNTQLIKELEDLRYKNQLSKIYQYVSEMQKENLQRILSSSQDILAQMSSSSHLYNSEQSAKSLKEVKNTFAQNLQLKFEPITHFVRSVYTNAPAEEAPVGNQNNNNFAQTITAPAVPHSAVRDGQPSSPTRPGAPARVNLLQPPFRQARNPLSPHTAFQQYSQPHAVDETPTREVITPQQPIFSRPVPLSNAPTTQQQQQQQYAQPFVVSEQNQQTQPYKTGSSNIRVQEAIEGGMLRLKPSHTIRTDHTDILLCFTLVGDEIVATGSKDCTIGLHTLRDGTRRGKLQAHTGSICSLVALPSRSSQEKQLLASGSDHGDCSIIVWDVQNQKPLRKLTGHSAAVVALLALDDAQTLISASYDKDIIVWNHQTGQLLSKLSSHASSVAALALTKDKQRFISCGLDNLVNVWRINYRAGNIFESCYLERTIKNNTFVCSLNTPYAAADLVVAGCKDGKIKLFNVATGETERTFTVNLGPLVEVLLIEGVAGGATVLSCSTKDKNLIATGLENGNNALIDVQERLQIDFGCGIGPKMQFCGQDHLLTLSQKSERKEVTVWELHY